MKKIVFLKGINLLLIFDFLLLFISILFYKVIPGDLNGSEIMSEMHETTGMIFFLLAILHVILNFGWIKANYLKRKK